MQTGELLERPHQRVDGRVEALLVRLAIEEQAGHRTLVAGQRPAEIALERPTERRLDRRKAGAATFLADHEE